MKYVKGEDTNIWEGRFEYSKHGHMEIWNVPFKWEWIYGHMEICKRERYVDEDMSIIKCEICPERIREMSAAPEQIRAQSVRI